MRSKSLLPSGEREKTLFILEGIYRRARRAAGQRFISRHVVAYDPGVVDVVRLPGRGAAPHGACQELAARVVVGIVVLVLNEASTVAVKIERIHDDIDN